MNPKRQNYIYIYIYRKGERGRENKETKKYDDGPQKRCSQENN